MISLSLVGLGLAGLLLSLLTFFVPHALWQRLAPTGSRLAHRASVTGLVLFLGLGLLGTGLVLRYAQDCYHGWRSTQWPQVEAVILESRLQEVRQIRSTNPAFRPEVLYAYTFEDVDYRGHRVDLIGSSSVDRGWIEARLRDHYTPGTRVRVSVDPRHPERAVLEAGLPPMAPVLLILGITFVGLGVHHVRMLFRDWEGDGLPRPLTKRERKREKRRARQWAL